VNDGIGDKTAIVGVGYTPFSTNSGVSTLTLALRAIMAALEDAGLSPADVDGVATHRGGDSTPPQLVADSLGIAHLNYVVDQQGGGGTSHAVVAHAALALAAGLADCVVCYRAINARSEMRMGFTGRAPTVQIESQYLAPYGFFAPPQHFAMVAREYMIRYGARPEHFGALAVQSRANAVDNPRAMMRTPITLDDYFNSRPIVEPFRLLDCCLETDACVALVLTRADRARTLRKPPALIRSAAIGGGYSLYSNQRPDHATSVAKALGEGLFKRAGMTPGHIDVAELYDCFTYSVVVQLEDYGFCAKGQGGPYIASGATARQGGELPVNTHGGFLSEGYVHGFNHMAEAVLQLRGEAGPTQAGRPEVVLSTGQAGYAGGTSSALILRRAA
jgi:acetyl-CoA acetyltransferase